jgi:hypothetical protein
MITGQNCKTYQSFERQYFKKTDDINCINKLKIIIFIIIIKYLLTIK